MIDTVLEKDLLPECIIRFGIRRLLKQRIQEITHTEISSSSAKIQAYADALKKSPIAESTQAANEQHYEVPAEFYQKCLGKNLKYSGCLYPTGRESLSEAEERCQNKGYRYAGQ